MKSFILLGASLNTDNRAVYSMTKAQIMLIFNKYGIKSEIKIINIGGASKVYKLFYKEELVLIKEYGVSKKCVVQAYIKAKLFLKRNVIIEKVLNADYVWDIGGGQEFGDNLNIKEYIIEALLKLIVVNKKKEYILLSQVIGPFKAKWRKKIAKKILNHASVVYVRDTVSKDTLLFDLKIISDVRLAVDIAFYADEIFELVNKPIQSVQDTSLKVGINISSNVNNHNIIYSVIIEELVERINKNSQTEILLFSYEEGDYDLAKEIEQKLKKKIFANVRTVSEAYNGQELKDKIRGCDVFIGSSLYSCIDAITACIPTVLIAVNEDTVDAWKRVGLEKYLCDLAKINKKEIIEKVEQVFLHKEEVNRELKVIIPKLIEEIEENITI